MFEWSEELLMVRDAVRTFVDTEIRPHREELEHGDLPPYDLLRKLYKTFGMDQMAADSFDKRIAAEEGRKREEAPERRAAASATVEKRWWRRLHDAADHRALQVLAGHGHRDGRVGRAHVGRDHVEGHDRAEEALGPRHRSRWTRSARGRSPSPAPAPTRSGRWPSTARRDGDEYVLNGSKTFITNGPYADTIVFICKLDEGNEPADRKVVQFVLDSGMPGLEQSKPLRKMGLHSSPTGMLFLDDVRVGRDRLLGESEEAFGGSQGREASKATFVMERSGVAAMALGIIERCLELSVKYAKERVQFGKPIGEFQLIQLKLAKMEVARLNVENLVFRVLESSQAGKPMNLSEASAMKLYSAGRGDRGRARSGAALRRQRLHGRVRGRAARARREGAADLRGHRRDPGRPDRARAARLTPVTGVTPVEPPPSRWELPDPDPAGDGRRSIAVGGDLEPGTVLDAYRRGLFPMRADGMLAWWSPDPRGVIPLDGFHVSRSLRPATRALRDPRRHRVRGGDARVRRSAAVRTAGSTSRSSYAYTRLHELGWAHSVEAWRDGELVGGLYGLRIGGLFAGESMFHRVTDASKVACWATVELLAARRRAAVRRAVDDAAPADAGRGRRDRGPSTSRRLARALGRIGFRLHERRDHLPQPGVLEVAGCARDPRGAGVSHDVVRYLDTPPDRATLERILDAIPDEPQALVRTDDAKFKALGIPKADVTTREQVIDVLLAHPEVMQRPVVFVGDRAVIARPSEKVLDLLD